MKPSMKKTKKSQMMRKNNFVLISTLQNKWVFLRMDQINQLIKDIFVNFLDNKRSNSLMDSENEIKTKTEHLPPTSRNAGGYPMTVTVNYL